MRISDSILHNNFLNNLSATKAKVEKLNSQIAHGVKIQRPSDSPDGVVKVLRIQNQIGQTETYKKNIKNSQAFLKETTFSMENIQSEVTKTLTDLTSLNNATLGTDFSSYATKVDLAIKSLLESANSTSDGKYIFGGTDFSQAPFGYSADGKSIEVKSKDISGAHNVKFSNNISQKINITGSELFNSIVTQGGNLDSTAAIGAVTTNQVTVYDAKENPYTMNVTYQKTAANTYSMTYDVLDATNTTIFASPPAAKQMNFSASGKLMTVDGKEPSLIQIKDSSKRIDFSINLENLEETNTAASVSMNLNQKNDIFNTLINIRDQLKLGVKPTVDQENILKDFNLRALDKLSEAGDVISQLDDVDELNTSQADILQELLSGEQNVDTAKAIMELQNQDYILQMTYKLSSMILPKSLLDYL